MSLHEGHSRRRWFFGPPLKDDDFVRVWNSTRIAPRRLERELHIMHALWLEQKQYIEDIDPLLGASFPAIEHNPLYLKMNYIRHRLNNDPAMHQAHRDLCRYGLRAGSQVDRFWRYSNHLPRLLFQRAVDLLLTQSVWKEMVTRAIGRRRSAQ